MQKSEWVYRELLYQRLEKKRYQFTQLAIAKKLRISLSTVNHALVPLETMGAIVKTPMGLKLLDPKKLLFLWASKRTLNRQVIFQTRADLFIPQIEKNMPSGIVYAAYSAYKFKFEDVPADYGEVYVYATEETLKEIKRRFPEKGGPPNLFVLQADSFLPQTAEGGICSMGNMFVDVWNIRTWYAKEFLRALEKRIEEAIGK